MPSQVFPLGLLEEFHHSTFKLALKHQSLGFLSWPAHRRNCTRCPQNAHSVDKVQTVSCTKWLQRMHCVYKVHTGSTNCTRQSDTMSTNCTQYQQSAHRVTQRRQATHNVDTIHAVSVSCMPCPQSGFGGGGGILCQLKFAGANFTVGNFAETPGFCGKFRGHPHIRCGV